MDYITGEKHGSHYISLKASDSYHRLWLDATQNELAMISQECPDSICNSDKKIPLKNSEHHFREVDEGPYSAKVRLLNDKQLQDVEFAGW